MDTKVKSVEEKTTAKASTTDAKKVVKKTKTRTTSKSKTKKTDSSDVKVTAKKDANLAKEYQSAREVIDAKINAFFEANKDAGIKKLVSAAKLMEAGAQIGVPTRYWNPKMKPFIYPKRGKTHIIDILKTMVFLDRVYNFLRDITKQGGRVLIVGTRGEIIKEHIKEEAKRAKAFYVNQRWLGGTLTNFKTISRSIDKLNNLIALQLSDGIKKYSKKEQLEIYKYIDKRGKFLGGIRTMRSLPQAIIVTDPVVEHNAVDEANQLKIPVIAITNTNANPDKIDFIIPANSGSIKTVYLIVSILCDAIAEGNGEPTRFIGKNDEEIILPEVAKKNSNANFVNHKHFGKQAAVSEETKPTSQLPKEA